MNEQMTDLPRSILRDGARSPGWLTIVLAVCASLIADVAGTAALAATCDLDLSQGRFQRGVCEVTGAEPWSLLLLALGPAAAVTASGILARRHAAASRFNLVGSAAVVFGITLVAWSAITG